MSSVAKGSNPHIVVEQVNAILPNHTRDESESWVMVDFGKNRKLLPDRYCVLHGDVKGGNALRHWEIQAKIGAGDEWLVLRAYRKNKKMKVACHSAASWKLKARYIHICICIYTYTYTYIYLYLYLCTYLYISIHLNTQVVQPLQGPPASL
jgi:hypothetical protein